MLIGCKKQKNWYQFLELDFDLTSRVEMSNQNLILGIGTKFFSILDIPIIMSFSEILCPYYQYTNTAINSHWT